MFWGKIKEMSRIVRELPPDGINVPDGRVRRITYDDGLRSLADSIRDHGVIEPLIGIRQAKKCSSVALRERVLKDELALDVREAQETELVRYVGLADRESPCTHLLREPSDSYEGCDRGRLLEDV